ncbi:MAG: hypothetical protein ACI91G_001635 [Gammaproteobacteria bacterium]|jgi:hypothetical protein
MNDTSTNPDLAVALGCSEADSDYLSVLSPEQQGQLTEQLKHARRAQRAHVRGAALDAINHLPRLLRKPLLKLFETT